MTETPERTRVSIQPYWALDLSLQQQSVLFLAARGPDGVEKHHPCKAIVRAYRGTVLVAAKFGRLLAIGEHGDTFMSMDRIAYWRKWDEDIAAYFGHVDSLPHHYHLHLLHGAQIVGYKHPDQTLRERWRQFYEAGVDDLHLHPETEEQMDQRLGDWGRADWATEPPREWQP